MEIIKSLIELHQSGVQVLVTEEGAAWIDQVVNGMTMEEVDLLQEIVAMAGA